MATGMDVAITGSTGLIGTALVERLGATGHRTIRVVRGDASPGGTSCAGIRRRARSTPPGSRVSTRSCTSRARASATSAGPTSASASSSTAGCRGRRCWRARSPGSSASLRCSCRVRRSATTAPTATSRSPRTARRATTSPPACAPSGRRRPTRRRRGHPRGPHPYRDRARGARGRPGALVLPFSLGLGGRIESGRQYMSWIALDDEVGAILHAITHRRARRPRQPDRAEPGHERRVHEDARCGAATADRAADAAAPAEGRLRR